MTTSWAMMQSQRRPQFGQTPQNFGNPQIDNLLGPKPIQQDFNFPYEGRERAYDRVHSYNVGADLGRMIVMAAARSAVSLATLFPVQEGPPDLIYLTWEIEDWGPSILPLVPEEGTYDVLVHASLSRKAVIQRRGISVPATIDALNTQQGMSRLASQFAKIMASTHWTLALMVVQAIRSSQDGPTFRFTTMGNSMNLRRQIEFDAARAFSWAKDAGKEATLDLGLASAALNLYTTGPFVVLVASDHISTLREFAINTPKGVKLQALTPNGRMLDMMTSQSNIIFTDGSIALPVQPHVSQNMTHRVQELNRIVKIAEYYMLDGIPVNDLAHRTGKFLAAGGYTSALRNRRIYNVKDSDQFDPVSYEESFLSSGFVPGGLGTRGAVDHTADWFNGRNIKASEFNDPRSAPMRVTRNPNTGRNSLVRVFGEFDNNVVSVDAHRSVAATMADNLYNADKEIQRKLIAGGVLLRELEQIPWGPIWDDLFLQAGGHDNILSHESVVDNNNNLSPLEVAFADNNITEAVPHVRLGNIRAYKQTINGRPEMVDNPLALMQAAITATGTAPPGLVSVGGLELLKYLGTNGAATAIALGKRASELLDVAKYIYQNLKTMMPGSMTFDTNYREAIYTRPETGGFNTWFTNTFMNTTHVPLVHTMPNHAAGGGGVTNILTWLVITEGIHGSLTAPELIPATQAFLTGNVAAVGDPRLGTIGGRVRMDHPSNAPIMTGDAMKRTTWSAMWGPLHRYMSTAKLRQRSAQGSSSGSGVSASDLFGMRSATAGVQIFGTPPAPRQVGGAPAVGAFGGQGRATLGGGPGVAGELVDPNAFSVIGNPNVGRLWRRSTNITDEITRVCFLTYLMTPCNHMDIFRVMFERNIYVPFKIKLDRVQLVMEASTPIVLKPGQETGITVITQSNLMAGGDSSHQRAEWTFSFWATTAVVSPQRIYIMPNRIPVRYLSGGGVRLYTDPRQLKLSRKDRPDLVPFVVPVHYKPHLYEPQGGIDVDGIFGDVNASRYPDAQMNETRWGLKRRAVGSRGLSTSWTQSRSIFPDYLWRGSSLDVNGGDYVRAGGHRSEASHPGCRKTWNGLKSTFPTYTQAITIPNN